MGKSSSNRRKYISKEQRRNTPESAARRRKRIDDMHARRQARAKGEKVANPSSTVNKPQTALGKRIQKLQNLEIHSKE